MRTIKRSSRFKKDFKRESRAGHGQPFVDTLTATIQQLAEDATLPPRLFDHALTGNWHGYRDCHIRPDIVLIYQKPDLNSLDLVRLGSHSELFKGGGDAFELSLFAFGIGNPVAILSAAAGGHGGKVRGSGLVLFEGSGQGRRDDGLRFGYAGAVVAGGAFAGGDLLRGLTKVGEESLAGREVVGGGDLAEGAHIAADGNAVFAEGFDDLRAP